MRAISRFESNLLRILYCFLGQARRAEALPLLARDVQRPRCLSRDAVELAQAALAKGCVCLLARGGWRRERFLRDEDVVEGRVWERTRPEDLGLSFSRNTLDFLIWLTARNPAASQRGWSPRRTAPMTLGDRFLLFLAYRAVRGTEIAEPLRRRQAFAGHGLCRLAFPDDFADVQSGTPLDLETWTTGMGACIVEALQHELADHWVRVERGKAEIVSGDQMRALGAAQERVLTEFLDRLEAGDRRDLARFLLVAASRLLSDQPPAEAWIGRLDLKGLTMVHRAETYRAAFAFLRMLRRLERWQRQAQTVGYFDEGYAASQLWKADWERFHGDACCSALQSSSLRSRLMGQAELKSPSKAE